MCICVSVGDEDEDDVKHGQIQTVVSFGDGIFLDLGGGARRGGEERAEDA
jgi:hypothetical protein